MCGLLSRGERGAPTSTDLFGQRGFYLKQSRRYASDFCLETISFPLKETTLLQGILTPKLCSECLDLATHYISANEVFLTSKIKMRTRKTYQLISGCITSGHLFLKQTPFIYCHGYRTKLESYTSSERKLWKDDRFIRSVEFRFSAN